MDNASILLKITEDEFYKLTGVASTAIPLKTQNYRLLFRVAFVGGLGFLGFGVFCAPFFTSSVITAVLHLALAMGGIALVAKHNERYVRKFASLRSFLPTLQKYNHIAHAADLRIQLERAGNVVGDPEASQRAIAAISLVRQDLVRALKTERILRENQQFLDQHPMVFTSDLATIETRAIDDRAGEWAQLFDESMQIALAVQTEMQQLQAATTNG